MNELLFHTPESAPEPARAALESVRAQFGFVPNIFSGLANAPSVLQAYLSLADHFMQTSLSPVEQQVVLLATSVENGCEFCVAAHSLVAKAMVKVPESVVNAIRDRKLPDDDRLAALTAFTRSVVTKRGWVLDHPTYARFIKAGYGPQQALEVMLGVAQKTLSNYANHLLQTPLNPAFESECWSSCGWSRG